MFDKRTYFSYLCILTWAKLFRVAKWRKVKERCLMSCCLILTAVLTMEDAALCLFHS